MATKRPISEEDVEKKRARMEDGVTKLPVDLQLRILSLLEAKQAVQTLLLSKTWISLWTQIPVLEFISSANHRNLYAFDRFVYRVLHLLRDRSAKLDRLTYRRDWTSSNKMLKTVFDFAISHGVKQLQVQIHYTRKHPTWPDFSLQSLKSLELRSLEGRMECPFLGPRSGSFKNLTDLYLQNPFITDEEPFSRFPVLWRLRLIRLHIGTEGNNLSLRALNLTYLTISCYQTFNRCVMTTPRLRFFIYQGSEFPNLITPAGGLPLLHTMIIGDSVVNWWCWDKKKIWEKRVFYDLLSMFGALSNVTSLTLLTSVVDLLNLFPYDLVKETSPFRKLKSLKLDLKERYYKKYLDYPSYPRKWPTQFSELPPCVKAYLLNNSPDTKVTLID